MTCSAIRRVVSSRSHSARNPPSLTGCTGCQRIDEGFLAATGAPILGPRLQPIGQPQSLCSREAPFPKAWVSQSSTLSGGESVSSRAIVRYGRFTLRGHDPFYLNMPSTEISVPGLKPVRQGTRADSRQGWGEPLRCTAVSRAGHPRGPFAPRWRFLPTPRSAERVMRRPRGVADSGPLSYRCRSNHVSISRRAIDIRPGMFGRESALNHFASTISFGSISISPLAHVAWNPIINWCGNGHG